MELTPNGQEIRYTATEWALLDQPPATHPEDRVCSTADMREHATTVVTKYGTEVEAYGMEAKAGPVSAARQAEHAEITAALETMARNFFTIDGCGFAATREEAELEALFLLSPHQDV